MTTNFLWALSVSFFSSELGSEVGKSESDTNPTVYDCYELVFLVSLFHFPVRLTIKIVS